MNRFAPLLSTRWPWFLFVALWLIAAILIGQISFMESSEKTNRAAGSAWDVIFSSSRHALSGDFYQRADEYFHKGVVYFRQPTFRWDPYRTIANAVSPEAHLHVAGNEAREIIPWLRLATRMDPHNIDAYLVMAFWLATAIERPDIAYDVICEAQRNNPDDYRVALEKGRLLIRLQKFERAGRALDLARKLWRPALQEDDTQPRLDRAEMITLRALIHEHDHDFPRAAELLTEVLQLFPGRTTLRARIADLRAGHAVLEPAASMMRSIVFRTPTHMTPIQYGNSQDKHDDHDTHHGCGVESHADCPAGTHH